jgi:hypothetical protein
LVNAFMDDEDQGDGGMAMPFGMPPMDPASLAQMAAMFSGMMPTPFPEGMFTNVPRGMNETRGADQDVQDVA